MPPRSSFIKGPAGTGKTSFAIQHIRALLDAGAAPERMLVLVPQRTLGQPYNLAFADPGWPPGAQTDIATLGGLARRGLEIFWPLVAEKAGFAHPRFEPRFLTIETAQYFMAGFVNEAVKAGIFDSVSVTPFDIMRQTLDNLSKAAVNGFALSEIADRLIAAWGGRHSSRPPVYRASADLAQQFRAHCLANNLLDFSLQIKLYMDYLLAEPLYSTYFRERYRHLIADNLEESFPVVADFVRWAWDNLDSALLVYDTDAGYRVFLGADPAGMEKLQTLCEEIQIRDQSLNTTAPLIALTAEMNTLFSPDRADKTPDLPANPRAGFTYAAHRFYPQMIDWVIEHVAALIDAGVSPREIVVLAPFLGDSLRFALTTRLEERGIPVISHRPSRAVRDEPAARALLTLTLLAHPDWGIRPPVLDVADALRQVIPELDPVRAWLLAQIVYSPAREALGSFDIIQPNAQQRITYVAGEKYEYLRQWLLDYYAEEIEIPPDHFLSRLFGEVLAQPGYGFHGNLEAGRIIAELVESARKFRQTLYPDGVEHWRNVSRNYVDLVQEGLLAALYVASWRDEQKDAVFLAPAYTFLMRNRWVDYQFWLDVGSSHWFERLEQPLTHPYVLSRNYPPNQIWTDDMETSSREANLHRLLLGLTRRCRQHLYIGIADLGEQGYEQRGPLLGIMQQIVQRNPDPVAEPDESTS
ncbi:MAG: hypothetical protein JXA10_10705 [Anaerolineae bacterium]|nr:hypothetical protein [Anaerolineae bacterium]